MRPYTVALLFCLSGFVAQANEDSAGISKPSATGSGCDLAVPGIDKAKFLEWFPRLKAAAAAKDPKKLGNFIDYPLQVNSKPKKTIKDKNQLEKEFSKIFTPRVLDSISSQAIDRLFCNYQGVMTGDGEVWINQIGNVIGITTINPE